MAILLIRHGETPGNRNRIIQVPETPLSDLGLEQAARLGARLSSAPIAEIWCSHLTRARQTAAAVERTTRAPLREVPDLEERNMGALRGTPYADFDEDPFRQGYAPPEGETWEVFHARVDRTWEQIARHWADRYAKATNPGHLVVVSHGLFLRSLLERRLLSDEQLEQHGDAERKIEIRNTALSLVQPAETASSSSSEAHRVELVACTAHLDGDSEDGRNPAAGI